MLKHEYRHNNDDPPIIDALMRFASTIESTGGIADKEDGDGVAANPEWIDLRDAYERAVEALDAPDLAVYRAAPELLQRLEWISKRWEMEPKGAVFPCGAMRDDVLRLIAEAKGGAR